MNSKQISTALAALEARRESLSTEQVGAQGALEAARSGLVAGTTPTSKVTGAQATFSALSEALAALDAQIATRRADLAAAERQEKTESDRKRHAELAEKRRTIQAEYDQVSEATDAHLSEAVARLLDLRRRNVEARREMDALVPPVVTFTDRGLQDRTLRFGGAIATAIQIVANEADRLRSKASSRAATERRQQQEQQQERERQRRIAEAQPEAA
jgi:hypothetical protein